MVATYGFTSRTLIESLYSQLGLTNILDDLTDSTDVINQFIRDAEQTVYSRLNQYFNYTDMVGNAFIESRTTWIAAHLISKRRGNEHYFEDMYEDALREIDAIATGELPPPVDIPLRDYSYPAMSNFTVDDRFGIAKLRVRPTISYGGPCVDQDISYGFFWGWV
jgi:hypothetical protein